MFIPKSFFDTRPVRSSGVLLVSLFLTFVVSLYPAQTQSQKDQETKKKPDEEIKLETHLVTMDVIVKDKKGKYVTDLKAEDFTIFENGVMQKVEIFEPPLGVGGEAPGPKAADLASDESRLSNLISIVLDRATTDPTNFKQVREGTIKYIQERITGTDSVGVFGISSDLQLLQSFTNDKARLVAAVEKSAGLPASNKNTERREVAEGIANKRAELSSLGGESVLPTDLASGSRALIANRVLQQFKLLRGQLSVQQARPVLAALAALCAAQRGLPGKKSIVLFSQGFITATILDWQVQSLIDIAHQANVAIYVIDSAGVRTTEPLSTGPAPSPPLAGISGLASTEERIRAVGGENVFDNVRHEGQNREYDILYRISGDTGGEFIKGTNDLFKGLNRIDQENRSRYTLAYYSTDANFDGSYRKLKVEVRHPDVQVVSRSGYYAKRHDEVISLSLDDKKLLDNVTAAETNPGMPLFVELSPFRSKGETYVVPLSLEVPPSAMKFDRKGNKQNVQFDVVGVIRDSSGKMISRLGGGFNAGLTAEQYESVMQNKISFRQDMELAPGAYNIELVFRDRLSGKIAAKKRQIVLPVIDSEFSMSGVALSYYVESTKKISEATELVDVFSQGGVRIRPSPSREFRSADNLIVFFELYNTANKAETGKPMVLVTLKLMKDNQLAIKPVDYLLTETMTTPASHMLFAKFIKLAGLQAGKYVAVIEARDLVTKKSVARQEPFVIIQ